MEGEFHIGCSGYYYSTWKNNFYPEGLPPAEWLSFYSMIFDTVELNGTFYRKPRISALQKYADQTPVDFSFSVKMSRFITHILRMKDAGNAVREFQDIVGEGLGAKLSTFLFQLPATFRYTPENLDRVLNVVPPGYTNTIEFRDESWWNDEVRKALMEQRISFCNVDFPGLATPIITTGPKFYMRLHGNPVLFKSSYGDEALERMTCLLPDTCDDYRIYFNNTWFEAGYTNAARMMELLSSYGRV